MKIGIIAGETSGDYLGAELILALKTQFPDAQFIGIAGPGMQAAGCHVLEPMESIAVMGLWEIIKDLPRLFKLRRRVTQQLLAESIDLFIGIDAPEFNLFVEKKLHHRGIRTVHYVSPSVWAWRKNRIHRIKRDVDLMLTLFPFETDIYQQHQIPVAYVGHPLAQAWPRSVDTQAAKQRLNLTTDKIVVALLPGSRHSELEYMAPLFLQTAQWCQQQRNDLQFIAPMVNDKRMAQWQKQVDTIAADLPLITYINQVRDVLAAADVVLVTSGTATLETLLAKKPMVVGYRLSNISYFIFKCLVKLKHIALPNLLAKKELVPEFIQSAATPDALGQAVLNWLDKPDAVTTVKNEFEQLHQQLKLGGETAAQAICEHIKENNHNEKGNSQAHCGS